MRFSDECRAGRLRPAASPVVIKELGRADPPVRDRLLALFAEIDPAVIPTEPPVTALADAFLRLGVVPPSKPDDALHVAAAFAAECEVLVSWNFKHITNIRRAEKFNAVARLRATTARLPLPCRVRCCMPPNDREYKMVEEVRRWRREVFEERARMTPEEIAQDERRLIESMGLKKLIKPVPPPMEDPSKLTPPIRRAG